VLGAGVVGVRRVERLGVLRPQLEHVTDLDAAVDRQLGAAPGARVAAHHAHEIGPEVDVEVPPEHRVLHVVVGLVRTGDPGPLLTHQRVGHHVRRALEVGADVPLWEVGAGREVVVAEESRGARRDA